MVVDWSFQFFSRTESHLVSAGSSLDKVKFGLWTMVYQEEKTIKINYDVSRLKQRYSYHVGPILIPQVIRFLSSY